MEKKLAIIIPAYKPEFLEKALVSIDNQTNKNFQVYIGNDGSPHDLYAICRPFIEKNGWKYHAFENNLGGENLVAHWNRCVALSMEEWIWLFSDDDEMAPDCVEAFFKALKMNLKTHVYRFNFSIINQNSSLIQTNKESSSELYAYTFGKLRFERTLFSSAVEYIFSRGAFNRERGFVNFPAAWCSDDASWIAFTSQLPIRQISGGMVFWRISEVNISGGTNAYRKDKVQAAITYIRWFNDRFPDTSTTTLFGEQIIWLRLQLEQNKMRLSLSEVLNVILHLQPKRESNVIRTFNELFLRNTIIQNDNTKQKAFRFIRILSRMLGKY